MIIYIFEGVDDGWNALGDDYFHLVDGLKMRRFKILMRRRGWLLRNSGGQSNWNNTTSMIVGLKFRYLHSLIIKSEARGLDAALFA